MLTTIEAEIDVNGKITLLEPLKISKKSRVIITLLDDEKIERRAKPKKAKTNSKVKENEQQLEWLKANRDKYAGKYVALDGDRLIAHSESLQKIHQLTRGKKGLFIVKVFAEETILSAGL